jgi:dihydroflavonol-4-reductase
MKVIVIGASGHIGNAVTRALLERGDQVTACGRRKLLPVTLAGLPIRYVPGDARKKGQFSDWIEGHEIVIDAAAPYPLDAFSVPGGAHGDPFLEAERRTRWLLEGIARHNALLVYVGSFVTLARSHSAAYSLRDAMIRLAHPYFQVKALIESQICDAARSGVRAVIVNPTYCLGPWDLRDRRLCTIPLLLCREIRASITQILNVIDVRDVALGILKAIELERFGAPILLAAHVISVHDLYSLICHLGSIPAPRLSIDADMTMLSAYWTELAFASIGREAPLRSGGMMMATAFDAVLPANGLAELEIAPRPLANTISDAIEWYRKIGYC